MVAWCLPIKSNHTDFPVSTPLHTNCGVELTQLHIHVQVRIPHPSSNHTELVFSIQLQANCGVGFNELHLQVQIHTDGIDKQTRSSRKTKLKEYMHSPLLQEQTPYTNAGQPFHLQWTIELGCWPREMSACKPHSHVRVCVISSTVLFAKQRASWQGQW